MYILNNVHRHCCVIKRANKESKNATGAFTGLILKLQIKEIVNQEWIFRFFKLELVTYFILQLTLNHELLSSDR